MFDLNTVLRVEPQNVRALCGRALLHLAPDQQKVAAPPSPTGPGTRRLGGSASGERGVHREDQGTASHLNPKDRGNEARPPGM